MKPFITETESATVIVIPKGATAAGELFEHGTYCWHGESIPLPEKVLKAAALWSEGKRAADISDACKLSKHAENTDAGQRLLGAIRIVLPALLPPRATPPRRPRRDRQ